MTALARPEFEPTAPRPQLVVFEVRCHRCSYWLGEAARPLQFAGLFKAARQERLVEAPRWTWLCKHCGWTNVFKEP